MASSNFWKVLGYVFLGTGALVELVAHRKATSPKTLGNLPDRALPTDTLPGEDAAARAALDRAARVIQTARTYEVNTIDERVSYIRTLINKSSALPEVYEAARTIVSRKCGTRNNVRWCLTPKDYAAEITAVYRAVQDPASPIAVRYVRDHLKIDQFTRADKIMRIRAGDCDDGTVLLGSLLMSIGYPVRMRVIQDTRSSSWSHIYLLVNTPPGSGNWVPLDWSVYPWKPAGWQAPGADDVAKTGKPSGMVVKLRDFEV